MRTLAFLLFVAACLFSDLSTYATIFGKVQGIVHDPQHRPIANASVNLQAATSDWNKTTQTDQNGEFSFTAVPIGDYIVTVAQSGFETSKQSFTVTSGATPVLHFQLNIASVNQTTVVSAENQETVNADSVTPTALIGRQDIARTPGADRTNSLQMITDFVPGAYYTHDQLHIRGGHQVSWLIDGVPIPNTNIASNLGPQIDPKDIDTVESQRGSYAADYGDRTYGIFNIAPRTGFERNNEAELIFGAGSFYQSDDQLNFGGHTNRFAYYASLGGNRTNLGLQTPTSAVIHDAANGYGGFTSLVYTGEGREQLGV